MSYFQQHELGVLGMALSRTWLIGDRRVSKHVLQELINMIHPFAGKSSFRLADENEFGVLDGYKNWSDTYDLIPNLLIDIEEPVTKSILKKLPIGDALDAACGTGRYSKFLSSLGHKVTGVDISADMLQKASAANTQISYIVGNLESIPVHDNSEDLITCTLALTHLPKLNKVISEFTRILRKNGHIIISDIHPWIVELGGQAEFFDKQGKFHYVRNYVHWHSDYIQAFQKNGLRIKDCLEPTLQKKHLQLAEKGFDLSRATVSAALEGLPMALIWVLTKI